MSGARVGTRNEATRDAWLEKQLATIPAEGRILDAGAGEQPYRDLCAHLTYVSQDFCEYDGRGDDRGLQMDSWGPKGLDIVGDIADIPEPDASFDAILCTEVLEHLPDPQRALDEFARLLRPGGKLILTAPFCSLTHFSPFHFASGFNRYFYSHHLAIRGFDVVELTANGNYFEFLAQELRRLPEVAEQHAGKRFGRVEHFALRLMLRFLARSSERDESSNELLCFGYHVAATRRSS